MTEKELRKLNRAEILELFLEQCKRNEALEQELAQMKEELESKRIKLKQAGSIAEASFALTNIFEEAQKTADLYLENIRMIAGEHPEKSIPERIERGEHPEKSHPKSMSREELLKESLPRSMNRDEKPEASASKSKRREEAAGWNSRVTGILQTGRPPEEAETSVDRPVRNREPVRVRRAKTMPVTKLPDWIELKEEGK